MVVVSIIKRDNSEETIECNYTRLKDGFLVMAWTDDTKKLRERIVSGDSIKYIVIFSESFSQKEKDDFNSKVIFLNTEGEEEKIECKFAKIKEGFLVIAFESAEGNKILSTQRIIPSHRIQNVFITSYRS